MTSHQARQIFLRLQAQEPMPTTELHYHSPFELLIAVMLSAQATDVGVNKATLRLFPVANTPEMIVALGEEKLKDYIKTINFYPTKAANIIKTCQRLITCYQSQVPNDRAALESLPGVGRKTANVILNTAFGQPTLAVDTHILRVANRLGLATGTTPLAVEQQLLQKVPKPFLRNAHHWLILHGRYVCKARKPACGHCILNDLCEYNKKTL